MLQARELTELRHYFAIKHDLLTAVSGAAQDDIDFHINELVAIQRHTASDRLRGACAAEIAKHDPPAAAATA